MKVYINPGSGPVEGAVSEENAIENIKHYITDLDVEDVKWLRMPEADDDGRYGFLLYKNERCHQIDMPGLPMNKVRFMREPDQDPWQFPRLYVDGASWLWCFGMPSTPLDWKSPYKFIDLLDSCVDDISDGELKSEIKETLKRYEY